MVLDAHFISRVGKSRLMEITVSHLYKEYDNLHKKTVFLPHTWSFLVIYVCQWEAVHLSHVWDKWCLKMDGSLACCKTHLHRNEICIEMSVWVFSLVPFTYFSAFMTAMILLQMLACQRARHSINISEHAIPSISEILLQSYDTPVLSIQNANHVSLITLCYHDFCQSWLIVTPPPW